MSLFSRAGEVYQTDEALWGYAPTPSPPRALSSATYADAATTRARLRELSMRPHRCREIQLLQEATKNTTEDVTCAPRSVRHFLRDARSTTLAFTDVYYIDTMIPETLRDEHGRAYETRNVRIHFMLRECETENEFDLYARYQSASPNWYVHGDRLRVAFDVVNSALVRPALSDRSDGKKRRHLHTSFYEDVARVYGVQFAPLYERMILRLDSRFPHAHNAPAALDVEFTSLLSAQRNARSAIQHAEIVNVYSTMKQCASGHATPSKESLAYFVKYYGTVYGSCE